MRRFLLRLLGADEDGEKLAAAIQAIHRLEQKIAVLRDEKESLRRSVEHWRHRYHEIARTVPAEPKELEG